MMSPLSRDAAGLAIFRRRAASRISMVLGLLVLLTVLFGVLNLFVLLRVQPRPFTLDLESSHYALSTPGAVLAFAWDEPVGPQLTVRSKQLDQSPAGAPLEVQWFGARFNGGPTTGHGTVNVPYETGLTAAQPSKSPFR